MLDYTRRFDTAGNEPRPLLVPGRGARRGDHAAAPRAVAGLQVAIANVALVAEAGVGADGAVELPQGQRIVLREVPVGSAAVYVPGGRAPYPSTVVMGVVTARSAGVVDVAVCAPPGPDGEIDPVILGTCRLCGVERVYRMGGAQAIAALAYGTDTVEPVDVIVGPGNLYVQEAKHQLSAIVGIDGFAGPSDLLVVLGAAVEAEPDGDRQDSLLAALDMLAQAEHGEGSLVVAISPSAAGLRRARRRRSSARRRAPDRRRRRLRDRHRAGATRGDRARQRVRPRAPAADRRRRRGARAAGPLRRLPVRRPRQRHRLRRLRRRLQPRAARRAAPRASPRRSRRATSAAR